MPCKLCVFLIWLVEYTIFPDLRVFQVFFLLILSGGSVCPYNSFLTNMLISTLLNTQGSLCRCLKFSLLQLFSPDPLMRWDPLRIYLSSLHDHSPILISSILKTVSYILSVEFCCSFLCFWQEGKSGPWYSILAKNRHSPVIHS